MTLQDYDPEQIEWLTVETVDRRYADLLTIVVEGEGQRFRGTPDQVLLRQVET